MNKKSNQILHPKVEKVLFQFINSPEEAYHELLNSRLHFNNRLSDEFWKAFSALNVTKVKQKFPDSKLMFNKLAWLKLFHTLNTRYRSEREKHLKELIALNPSHDALIKAFFLPLELGETSSLKSEMPVYSEENLSAIRRLLEKILPKLKEENNSGYSTALVSTAIDLINVESDISLISELIDAFTWGDFKLSKENDGYRMTAVNERKIHNPFVLNHLKTFFKREYYRSESQEKISSEEHFQKHDKTWKTNEGQARLLISGGEVVSQSPGATFLNVKSDLIENLISDNPEEKENAGTQLLATILTQHLHHDIRNALSLIYHPNDDVNIHDLHLEIAPSVYISLFELFAAMSCLIGKGKFLGSLTSGSMADIEGIRKKVKQKVANIPGFQNFSELEKLIAIDGYIIHQFSTIEASNEVKVFNYFEQNTLINWLREIEELKDKSTEELFAIVNLLSATDSSLPVLPLYKVGEHFYFSYRTCQNINLNQLLYDHYITDKLFNPYRKNKKETLLITKTHTERAKQFGESLKELFKTLTPYVESGLEYGSPKLGYDFGELHGDFDVIAYFEEENILFPIQIKLSNVSPRTEKRKQEWINKNIKDKGLHQVKKDLKLLKIKSGLQFVSDNLSVPRAIKDPKIYPILVTDNFFADHTSLAYNEKGDMVTCVSYFELKHLILNKKIHNDQAEFPVLKPDDAALKLIKAIEENLFWSFLKEYANKFEYSKSLSSGEIEMKV